MCICIDMILNYDYYKPQQYDCFRVVRDDFTRFIK